MILLRLSEILAMHDRALREHGGAPGIRDVGAIEAAIVAVDNRVWYEQADAITCAATYAFHLTMAHGFIDGNKRVAAATTAVFLVANDLDLLATEDELFDLFMSIAASRMSRDEVEVWLRRHVAPA